MVHIVFEYADELSNWQWRKQQCTVSSLEECKRIYGLYPNEPVKYRFISIEEVQENGIYSLSM